MTNYDEEKDYVREIYWESKGMGRSVPTLDPEPIVMAKCPKCNREGRVGAVATHYLYYCLPSKD